MAASEADIVSIKESAEGKMTVDALADRAVEAIAACPRDFAEHKKILATLDSDLLEEINTTLSRPDLRLFLLQVAESLPPLSTDVLYQKRNSLFSLGCLIALGWVLGGVAATFLGLLGLGGEILRPLAIFAVIWGTEYLGAHPGARRILLVSLGLGGIVRFAGGLVGGMLRLGSLRALRQALFGAGMRTNIFKAAYMIFGAALLSIFLAKKVVGLDLSAFREALDRQLSYRLRLLNMIRDELEKLVTEAQGEEADSSGRCPRNDCRLAIELARSLGDLPPGLARFFSQRLEEAGYASENIEGSIIIWNSAEHSPYYESLGVVNDGDHCRVLEPAIVRGESISRGLVQKI